MVFHVFRMKRFKKPKVVASNLHLEVFVDTKLMKNAKALMKTFLKS